MIYVISYANGQPFEKYQKLNKLTAKLIGGADRVICYSDKDIPLEYKEKHSDIFSYKRGAGLWLWKSYLINRTLDMIQEGDWLFYNDAGCFFINSIKRLVKYAEKKERPIMLFGLPLLNRQFCKKECFELLGIEDNGENQVVGTYFMVKKTSESVKIMAEWLSWCEREELISPNRKYADIEEFPDFYSHREDQALLSLISIKYGIPLNKECSNFSVFPYEYYYKEFDYRPLKDDCSKYGVVLISHRAANPIRFYLNYKKKKFLKYLGIKYTEEYALKNPRSFTINIRNSL